MARAARHNPAMGDDPNFRLKALAVVACVLGVFLLAFVAQRFWYWMRTRGREDVETSRLAPIRDLVLLVISGLVIWISIEALVLSIFIAGASVQPSETRKVAEIEIGKLDRETGQTNLLFYPVDRAGRRQAALRRPVLTSGDSFELLMQVVQWRRMWEWLGGGGYYQFNSLGGPGTDDRTILDAREWPRGIGASLFLQRPQQREHRIREAAEGDVYDVYLDPSGEFTVKRH